MDMMLRGPKAKRVTDMKKSSIKEMLGELPSDITKELREFLRERKEFKSQTKQEGQTKERKLTSEE